MLVSICILLLAKLEKTPWLLKAANIHSPQEGLSNLTILSQEHLIYAGEHLYPAAGQAREDSLAPQVCHPTSILHSVDFLIFPFLSQEHLIYAAKHLYPAAGTGEDSLAAEG